MRRLQGALIALALAATVSAQVTTSSLTVTGTINVGQTVTAAVTGAVPNAISFLGAGPTLGTTTFNLGPLTTFSVGLAQPFIILPMGMTDASGNVSLSASVPANLPPNVIQNFTWHVQSVSLAFNFTMPAPGPLPPTFPLPTVQVSVSNIGTLISGTG